jgi:peptide/nickel transport system substrate-binding protein
MNGEIENYWTRAIRRRYSRRSALRAAALAGAAVAGAGLLACKSTPSGSSSPSKPAAQTPAPAGSAAFGLSGRTGTDAKGETPVQGGTLNWYIGGNPPTFDPHLNVSINTSYLASAVLSRPFRYKTGFDPSSYYALVTEPDLAASAESPDGTTWTLKLRPGVKFQNVPPVSGRAVEAEDFKATFTRATSNTNVNAANLSMIDPAQIQTPDTSTVVFKLKYPYAPFPATLASAFYSGIMPREAVAGA